MKNKSLILSIGLLTLGIVIAAVSVSAWIYQQRQINAVLAPKRQQIYTNYQGIYTEITTADATSSAGVIKLIAAVTQAEHEQKALTEGIDGLDLSLIQEAYTHMIDAGNQLKNYSEFKACVETFKPKYSKSFAQVEKYYFHYGVAQTDGDYSSTITQMNTLVQKVDIHIKLLGEFKDCFTKPNEYLQYFDTEANNLRKYKQEFVLPLIKVLRTGSQVKIQTFLNKNSRAVLVYVDNLYKKGEFQKEIDDLYQDFESKMSQVKKDNTKIITEFTY
jgi:hypothetical protein